MEFINGYHFQYEFMKFLKNRGLEFKTRNYEHPLHPDNKHNFGIRCFDYVTTTPGAPRFSTDEEDQYVFMPLNDASTALDTFIAAELLKPAAERKFPYETILIVHGHSLKMVTNGISGRRPNDTYNEYPILSASIEAPQWTRDDVNEYLRQLRTANIPIPERIQVATISEINNYNYAEVVRSWTNTTTYLNGNLDQLLTRLEGRFNNWKAVAAFICFFNASQETIRQREQELRREREEQARRDRERLERERVERERLRIQEGVARAESRMNAFTNFAPKKAKLEKTAQEMMEKFLMGFNTDNLQVVEGDSSDLTPTVNLEYANGVEIQLVATDKGLFIKNCIVPQNLVKSTLELFKGIKEK